VLIAECCLKSWKNSLVFDMAQSGTCRITKATNTHSDYVTHYFRLHQWLQERVSTYIVGLVEFKIPVVTVLKYMIYNIYYICN
jgi:hypothetical protein